MPDSVNHCCCRTYLVWAFNEAVGVARSDSQTVIVYGPDAFPTTVPPLESTKGEPAKGVEGAPTTTISDKKDETTIPVNTSKPTTNPNATTTQPPVTDPPVTHPDPTATTPPSPTTAPPKSTDTKPPLVGTPGTPGSSDKPDPSHTPVPTTTRVPNPTDKPEATRPPTTTRVPKEKVDFATGLSSGKGKKKGRTSKK
jgi:hypothetical protein